MNEVRVRFDYDDGCDLDVTVELAGPSTSPVRVTLTWTRHQQRRTEVRVADLTAARPLHLARFEMVQTQDKVAVTSDVPVRRADGGDAPGVAAERAAVTVFVGSLVAER